MSKLITRSKKIPTNEEGVFYKEIVNEKGKVVDKVFLIRYREHYSDKQLTIGKYSHGNRIESCKKVRINILNKINQGEDLSLKRKYTFEDAFLNYISWAKNNKESWKQDNNAFLLHFKDLKKYDLRKLTPSHFENIKQIKTEAGYKNRTIQYFLGLARQIINYSIKHKHIKNYTNPITEGKVKIPKANNEKIGFLTKEQAKELLEILKNKPSPLKYRLTVLLLYTGARFSEVASLTWYDIDFHNRLIFFKSTKNGNERRIYIVDEVLKVLKELKKEKYNNLVIPSLKGTQITQMPKQWQDIVDKLIPNNKVAGKYRITVHSLRHTHASWMAIAGIDIMQIKEQLGHKKIEMTLRYSHLMPSVRHENTKLVFESL